MRTQKVLPPNEPLLESGQTPIRSTWWRFFHNQLGDIQDATGIAVEALATRGPDLSLEIAAIQSQIVGLIPHQTPLVQNTGTWTPADNSGAGLAFTGVSAGFTQIGNIVFAYFTLTYPATVDVTAASIKGLPYFVPNVAYAQVPAIVYNAVVLIPTMNTYTASFETGDPLSAVTNATLSTKTVSANLIYPAS